MRKLCLMVLVILFLFGCTTRPNPGDYRHDQPSEFYLYFPEGYTPDRKWPIFVGIHGFGGSGKDCWSTWQSYADEEGFVLICPSLADAGGGWYQADGERKLVDIVNHVYEQHAIETDMFLAGFSAGAQFVQGMTAHYADWVKGVAVLSAGNYMLPTTGAKHVPYLIVIGDKDDPTSITRAEGYYQTLASNGFDVRFELLPGAGHSLTLKAKNMTIELFRKVNP